MLVVKQLFYTWEYTQVCASVYTHRLRITWCLSFLFLALSLRLIGIL